MMVKELCETCGDGNKKQAHIIFMYTCLPVYLFTFYSYANVSLTVNRDARRAGNALASVPNTSVKINQAITPLAPKTGGIGAVRMAIPTPKHNTFVIGMAIRMLIAQLRMPITIPSVMTMA